MKTSVFVTSHQEYDGKNVWQSIKKRLIELYDISDRRYDLVDDPDQADLIMVGCERTDSWGEHIFDSEVVKKHPSKTFTIHDGDYPIFLHHGIYSSNRLSILSHGRTRTGAYTLSNLNKVNPYIRSHIVTEADFKAKEYLFSFVGRNTHSVRQRLFARKFNRSDIYIEDTSHFNLWSLEAKSSSDSAKQFDYYRIMLKSKFALCPRGAGTGSMRLFEAMQLGIPPVIISDGWIPPNGPAWSEFSVIVKERNIGELEDIIQSCEHDYQAMGQTARAAYNEYFAEKVYFNYVVENCMDIMQTQKIPEKVFWKFGVLILVIHRLRNNLRVKSRIKRMIKF